MLKEIRRARQDDCPKILELLEYICALHSGIRPDPCSRRGSRNTTARALKSF